jgi:Cof subfamily protein (haloacid dehalogenase superfamily)
MQKILPLSGCLLVSDLDGTLLTRDFTIPERNITAIERFISRGGVFTFATGRTNVSAARYAHRIGLGAPAIIYNGGALFDFEKGEFIWEKLMPPSTEEMIRLVKTDLPDIGIELFSGDDVYIVSENPYNEKNIQGKDFRCITTSIDAAPRRLNKVVFTGTSQRLADLMAYIAGLGKTGLGCTLSDPNYLEMLPEGISKGSTLRVLEERLDIRPGNTMAIGDYYNDLQLIKNAAVSAVPQGAPQELKDAADVVVCRCENGAVADFIEYIENRFPAGKRLF